MCGVLIAATLSVLPPPVTVAAPAWYTQHISVSMTGGVSLGDHSPYNVDPRGPDISADGRYVVWTSSAADLVPGGTTAYNKYDVFWRDRVAGITKRVSDSAAGANGNDTSWGGVVSGDGLYVAFLSKASNLVDGDTNGVQDAFVRNMATGAIERVSVSDAEEQSTGWAYGPLAIADDDYSVLFSTHSSNFGSSIAQVYLRDWQAGTTVMVSRAADGQPGTDSSFPDDITPDGRFVAFTSRASNITGETGGYDHIVVRELDTETNRIASLTNAGEKMEAHQASLSDDGRYCAFHGERRSGSAAGIQCWVRDIQESTTEQVSRSTGGAGANGQSQWPEISGDGRYVVFDSYADNLVDGDTNGFPDVFRYERTGDTWATGVTERMSLTTSGEQVSYMSWLSRVSRDGRAVAFFGQGLIPEDNTGGQIYVRAFGEPPAPPSINIQGISRFDTAVAASLEAYPAGSEFVIIATGRNWPDALGGTALAGALGAPILLSEPASLPTVTRTEISRLGATYAIILGGTGAVGNEVHHTLVSMGLVVERVSGDDRYQTADAVAARTISVLGGSL
jgi:hypothetical protein